MLDARDRGPMQDIDVDVAVVGGGFAGLLVADRLSTLGYRVTVLERSPRLLAGSSSRNEGWLHAGTYHATSIADEAEALAVARRCLFGWREYRARYPHAIEPERHPAVAIVPDSRAADVERRWQLAGVSFAPLSRASLADMDDGVALTSEERAYSVADVGIETRMLAASIVRKLRTRGVELIVDAAAHRSGEHELEVRTQGAARRVRFRFLVLATGYGTEQASREFGLGVVPVRLWRSHLATVPRVAEMSVFGIQPGHAAMMNHGEWSIVGLNEDAEVVAEPGVDAEPVATRALLEAIRFRFPSANLDRAFVRSCVKVDYASSSTDPRSLNVRVLPVGPAAAVVLPGKMTEAPVVADAAAQVVFAALGSGDITARPHDHLVEERLHA